MKRTIEDLFKDAEDCDKDIKIIAADDLCKKLLEDNKTDEATQTKICNIFLKHLDSDSIDVQGNATKCIGKVVGKLQEKQLGELIFKLMNAVKQKNQQIRDIYVTCIKTVINEVTNQYEKIVCEKILSSACEGLKTSPEHEIQEELLDIINQIFKKFSVFLLNNQLFNKEELYQLLIRNLKTDKQLLRKKSSQCLGSLSAILSNKEIGMVIVAIQKESVNLRASKKKEILYYIQSLVSISKYVAHRLTSFVGELLPFSLDEIQARTNQIDYDDLDFLNELLEAYLNLSENLIKGCPKETREFLSRVLIITNVMISYDPNETVNLEASNAMEIENEGEDDYGWDADDMAMGDSSWRVRRSAIQLLDTLLKNRKEMIKEISESAISHLVLRLREKDENVRLDTFNALNSYFKAVVYEDINPIAALEESASLSLVRMKSSVSNVHALTDLLISELITLINSNAASNIKAAAANLLFTASLYVPIVLNKSLEKVFPLFVQFLEKDSRSGVNTDIKVNLLHCLRRIVRGFGEGSSNLKDYWKRILNICIKCINNDYFKISSEGFRLLSGLFKLIRPNSNSESSVQNYEEYVKPILGDILKRLKEHDIDQEIKQAVISNVSWLLNTFGDHLTPLELDTVLDLLLIKLKNEVTRINALKALHKLPTPDQLAIKINEPSTIGKIVEIVKELNGFLLKQSRTLRISTLESLNIFAKLLKNKLNSEIQNEILNSVIPFIKDEDFYLAQLTLELILKLIDLEPVKKSQYDQVTESCLKLAQSHMIQGAILSKLIEVLERLSHFKLLDVSATINNLCTSSNNKSSLSSVCKCIASLCLNMKERNVAADFVNKFAQGLKLVSDKPDQVIFQLISLNTLGEIGKKENFWGNKEIKDGVIVLLNSKNEDVKGAASIALGGLCLGNPTDFLPKVTELIKSPNENQYLLLNTLKEIIQNCDSISDRILDLVPFLFLFSEEKDESVRNIAAECIGKVGQHHLEKIIKELEENLRSEKAQRRYTAASSFKHFCTKTLPLEKLAKLFPYLTKLIDDKDIHVKRAAITSLNTIAYNLPTAFKGIDNAFFDKLKANLEYNMSNVKEVELGPYKYKVDEGLTLRSSAFSFVETAADTLINNIKLEGLFEEALKHGLVDPSDNIQLTSFHIIQKLSSVSPSLIIAELDKITEKLKIIFDKVSKSLGTKQEGDRSNDTLRGVIKTIKTISSISETETNTKFNDFFTNVSKNEKIKDIFSSV